MKVLGNGYFSEEWTSEDLAKGLRSNANSIRGQKTLTVCDGMVGQDGLLKSLPTLTLSSLYSNPLIIKDDFPFPQIFSLEKFLIVCNRTTVLEYTSTSGLVLKATVTGGELWSIASAHDFIYMSNWVVNLVRDPSTGTYSSSTAVPICSAMINFNGQIICGNIK